MHCESRGEVGVEEERWAVPAAAAVGKEEGEGER